MDTPMWKEAALARITAFFKTNEEQILTHWLGQARIHEGDPYYEEIIKNGKRTFQLVYDYIKHRDTDQIIELTKKIASERIQANVNISEFVHNINLGRSLVVDALSHSLLSRHDISEGIFIVNELFDSYLYYAVREYTKQKDSIIYEKNKFIQEMHSDRLTVLGQIASSFAHEFRNPLTSIHGFISLLEQKYGKVDEDNRFYFQVIDREIEQLTKKINEFLYLSKVKRHDDEIETFDLSEIVREMIDFMYPRFVDEQITVNVDINEGCLVQGIIEELKQVVLNIINNAVEVLTHINRERVIDITLSHTETSISLVIANNGEEIPTHLLENIFEPFITTKELGTGLGLSVVKQIIEKHNGKIDVDSTHKHTSFTIDFEPADNN
ncbi:histidine kinase N-terminal domain-containing protein [Desertibacillus haloalkaliphilus]|uniref:histidine kinase N-terminal domain-containing protein n=1 Tax=Desertibacillus haloalkaliphilus TaxID=1328930 RepID=UPI001C25A1A8|nr:histidine kinase N-terminal domain-containing protein [Desertibacillus haloalkaliphilus]MBU8906075.1 GHKL domain-containing protein [Desertibacillus haloalkaliphilus]